MTYSEKVDWLGGYLREASLTREMRQEMKEMKALMEGQRVELTGQPAKNEWNRERQAREAEVMEEYRMALLAQERRMLETADKIGTAIARVPSSRHRRILRMVYLVGMNQRAIAAELGYCRRHVCRDHQAAVRAVEVSSELLRDCG